jgi:hypothetical protein
MTTKRGQRQRLATGRSEPTKSRGSGVLSAEDRAVVSELQGRYTYASDQWSDIIAEGGIDVSYLQGHTWDDDDKRLRVGRLMLSFDQLNQYLNQLVNGVRQQKRAIKITPEGNGANDQTAQLRTDRIRQIEYLSQAQLAYIPAFQGAAERSYGYCRIVAEWEPKGFKQQLRIKPVPNPDQVLPDPDAQSITGRDWKYLFYKYAMTREEFQRDYPDASFQDYSDLSDTDKQDAGDWQGEDRVQVAEYWRVQLTQRSLVRLGTPQQYVDVFEDDRTRQQKVMPVLAQRMTDVPVVEWYLTNGVELLAKRGQPKKTEWKGTTIPFMACYGPIRYRDADVTSSIGGRAAMSSSRKTILSYIRLARSAQKYYNWIKSTEGEVISMFPRTPYMAYEGQLSPEQLLALQSSVHTPVAVVLANATSERTGDSILPLPRREAPTPPVEAYEVAAEAARRDIQNALGRYSSSVGKSDTNVRSGVLQKQLDQQSDQGSYHFVDAFDAMLQETGVKLEELLPFYDDTMGDISTRTASGTVKMVRVNDPSAVDNAGKPAHLPMDLGTHATTVSTGPSFDSEREEASAFADSLISNAQIDRTLGPQKAAQLLALAIKLKNVGPLGDEMSEIVNPTQQDDPKALQQHLHDAMGQLQKQSAVLAEMHKVIESKQMEIQSKERIEAAKNQNTLDAADKDNDTKIKIAEIQFASAANVADIKADLAHSLELMSTQLQHVQGLVEAHQAQLDRAHEAQAQLADQQHQREMATQQHAQSLEAGQQQQANTLESQQHAAALAPAPAEGA